MSLIRGYREPTKVNPETMVLFAAQKTGKTHLATQLEDHLIINCDDSADYFSCNSTEAIKTLKQFKDLNVELAKMCKANGGKAFKYGILDTASSYLFGPGRQLAIKYYNAEKGTTVPTSFNIEGLAYGAGYVYLRAAMMDAIKALRKYFDHLIILAHTKTNSVTTNGEELQVKDIDLPGRLKTMVGLTVDAVGHMYRGEDNKNYISFEHSEELQVGSRSPHLRNKVIMISELKNAGTPEETLETHWDEVFIPGKK